MNSVVVTAVGDRLRRYVRALKKDDDLGGFIQSINQRGEAFLFGGAPRDVLFVGRREVNDLDIFVSGALDVDELSRFCTIKRQTNFGGLRLTVGDYDVDIWELRKSYAFRFDSPSYVSVKRLLDSVCFSTDGIAVSLKGGKTISTTAFFQSLVDKRLDFIVPPSKAEAVVAVRIARLMLKLKLELTPSVASYFVQCCEMFDVSTLIDAEQRWGRRRMLNEISIEQVRAEISQAIARAYEVVGRPMSEDAVRARVRRA